jgi:hypothetical protein
MDKTLRRVTDLRQQQDETLRYWQSLSIGERLKGVCEATEQAYAFAAKFQRKSDEPDGKSQGHSSSL